MTMTIGAIVTTGGARAAAGPFPMRYGFGSGKPIPGYTRVDATTTFSDDRGYGFEPGRPTLFSVAVPEGNYDVTITFGGAAAGTDTTVKAESRRLMIERVVTPPGGAITRTFTVNVRNSRLGDGGRVGVKGGEADALHWDDKLTLEFLGPRPGVAVVEIVPAADDVVTVFIAGDSTVTDQANEPWAGWGQMLPRFFQRGVAVANHAHSGESLRSFRTERRLDKILSQIKPGDYLFIQFGHNDQKPDRPTYVDPWTAYPQELVRYATAARDRGATPVFVTSMHRRTFDDAGKIRNSHGDYPEAMRQAAREHGVPLIDLHAMSETFYEALGPETSKKAFVHYPAGTFPGQDQPLKDNSHFSAYGAYELARCVVEGIRSSGLGLALFLAQDVEPFDPSRPDAPEGWALPASPARTTTTRPAGS
jgi:lysophospholipase L1-like esterase